ncbi:MAG: hypothetical protein Q9161_005002 [Pseudevernia consocians]
MSFLTSLRPTTLRTPPLVLLLHTTTTTTRSFATSPASRLARMVIVGRLADSPEIIATSSGQDVIKYALATSSGPKDNRQTSWWNVACFKPEGPGRDLMMGLAKGDRLYVEGECSMKKFQNKDGNPVSALNIVQSRFEILDRKESRVEGQVESE